MLKVKMIRIGIAKPRALYIAENSVTGQAETLNGRVCFGSLPGIQEALEHAGYAENDRGEWSPAILAQLGGVACCNKKGERRGVTIAHFGGLG